MIDVDGVEYGRAAEVAARLGGDVTPAMVRNWARRDGLAEHRVGRAVYYPLGQAAMIERDKRRSTRGRPRTS
jgi:hypothetical protein